MNSTLWNWKFLEGQLCSGKIWCPVHK